MLSEKETNRVLRRFYRERDFFSRRMGSQHRERERSLEEARTASDYVLNIAQMLARRTAPARVETHIERDTKKPVDQFTVYLKLEGVDIGYFWIDPDDWLIPYGVSGSYSHFFRSALKKFGNLLIRKEAYRQLLLGRLVAVRQMVQAEFSDWLETGQMIIETDYSAESGWEVGQDYCCLRFIHGDWKRTLRAYHDCYTWGIAYRAPAQTLNDEDDVIRHVRQELAARVSRQLARPA